MLSHPAFLAGGGPGFRPDQRGARDELRRVGSLAPRIEATARLHTCHDRADHTLQRALVAHAMRNEMALLKKLDIPALP